MACAPLSMAGHTLSDQERRRTIDCATVRATGTSLSSPRHCILTRWTTSGMLGLGLARAWHPTSTHQCWSQSLLVNHACRVLDKFVGTPWAPTPAIHAMRMLSVHGVYIALDRQIQRGCTKGCPACFGKAKVHSTECRVHFEYSQPLLTWRPACDTPPRSKRTNSESRCLIAIGDTTRTPHRTRTGGEIETPLAVKRTTPTASTPIRISAAFPVNVGAFGCFLATCFVSWHGFGPLKKLSSLFPRLFGSRPAAADGRDSPCSIKPANSVTHTPSVRHARVRDWFLEQYDLSGLPSSVCSEPE